MDKNGGVAGFSVQTFMSHSDKKIRRRSLLCCVSEKVRQRKSLWIRGGLQDFLSETFCLTVPKITVGESFRLSLISGIEKLWTRVGGSITIFRRKCFVSECRIVSYGKPSVLCFRKFPVPKNFG